MKKTRPYRFYEQVKGEAKRIVWPAKKELTTSVIIVLVAVFLFSMISMVLDYGVHGMIQFLLKIGK